MSTGVCCVQPEPGWLLPTQGSSGQRAPEEPTPSLGQQGRDPALPCFPPTPAMGSHFGQLRAGTLGFNQSRAAALRLNSSTQALPDTLMSFLLSDLD